jgi:hypothetical protein
MIRVGRHTVPTGATLPFEEYPVRCHLQFFDRDFSPSVGLHIRVQPVELSDAGFALSLGLFGSTEFLKMNAYPV